MSVSSALKMTNSSNNTHKEYGEGGVVFLYYVSVLKSLFSSGLFMLILCMLTVGFLSQDTFAKEILNLLKSNFPG